MRILSVWDTAGTFVPIAAWLNDNGHCARIVMNREWDLFGQTSRSRYARIANEAEDFVCSVINEIRRFTPDLIQVNYIYEILPLIRVLAPRTPIVYQYHGSEIRQRNAAKQLPPLQVSIADKVIVSTEDLQQYGEWFDRPIPKIFYYREGRRLGTALMIYVDHVIRDQRNLAKRLCKGRRLNLTILDRNRDDPIPYEEMPKYLSTFEYLLDFKGHTRRIVLSKTALEALACGCKVIHDADITRTITSSSDFTARNRPSDYLQLYKTTKNRFSFKMKKLGIALAFLFMTRKGLYYLSTMARTILPRKSSSKA